MGIGTEVVNSHLLSKPQLANAITSAVPHVAEIMEERTALLLTCSHYVTHGAWPYSPNIVEVGGLHLREPSPLPENLQKLLDKSSQGAILVSFGSTLSPSAMGAERRDMFVRVFKALTIPVIWKWDSELPEVPSNVHILPWLPQFDILSHPNLKLFITHGGLLSLVEALQTKTPLVGIPFANDQRPNLLRAQQNGYAKMIDWADLTEENLNTAIRRAIGDNAMTEAVEIQHKLFTDRPHSARETAAWWVEHVCRQGVEGARVLRSVMMDTPWWQYHHIDLILAGSFLLGLTSLLSISFCRRFQWNAGRMGWQMRPLAS